MCRSRWFTVISNKQENFRNNQCISLFLCQILATFESWKGTFKKKCLYCLKILSNFFFIFLSFFFFFFFLFFFSKNRVGTVFLVSLIQFVIWSWDQMYLQFIIYLFIYFCFIVHHQLKMFFFYCLFIYLFVCFICSGVWRYYLLSLK